MKYNEKYDRWVSKDGLVYRYDKKNDKLVLCSLSKTSNGYICANVSKPKATQVWVHRIVYETFVGSIPQDYEIDHINTIRDDNRLDNLRCLTHKDNNNNYLTIKHMSEAQKGKTFTEEHKGKIGGSLKGNTNTRGKTFSEFGIKFKEHFGITAHENRKLYTKERLWYRRHNKVCRWEVEDKCKS